MSQQENKTIKQSIMAAFMILLIHVFLLGSIALLVLFFYGLINHLMWMIAGILVMVTGAILVYRRIRADSQALKDMAGDSFRGRDVEINFLGGMANIRISG